MEELSEAMKGLSSGKAPGPDGLPIELYRTFAGKLIPRLLEAFNESYEKRISKRGINFPPFKARQMSLRQNIISPISLMSCDTKILCKTLARQIESLIPNLTANNQNGFVLARQAFHKTRRLLNVLCAK